MFGQQMPASLHWWRWKHVYWREFGADPEGDTFFDHVPALCLLVVEKMQRKHIPENFENVVYANISQYLYVDIWAVWIFSCEQIELPQNLPSMDSVDYDHEQKQLLTCIRASSSVGKRFLARTQFLHGRDSFVPFEQPATKKTTRTIRHVLWRHELRAHLECCQQFGTTLKLSRLASVYKNLRKFQFSCFCLNVLTFVSARVHGWYWPSRQCFFATNHEVVLSCRPQRRSCGSKVASNEIGQIFFLGTWWI